MRGFFLSLALLVGCSASDDEVYLGGRAQCEFGGTLTDCENARRDVKSACWRLVDCGAIPLHYETNMNELDWDTCVGRLETAREAERTVVIACIASSTCDELRTGLCFALGDI
jgi:hypothetical protein